MPFNIKNWNENSAFWDTLYIENKSFYRENLTHIMRNL